MLIKFFALSAAVFMISTASQADEAKPKVSQACRAEVVKICPKSDDKKARHACIRQNFSTISAPCQAEIKAVREARQAAKKDDAAYVAPEPAAPPAPPAQ